MGDPPTGAAEVGTAVEDPSAMPPVPSGGSPMSRAWEIGGLRPGRAAQARLRIAADGEGMAPELETQTPMSSEPPQTQSRATHITNKAFNGLWVTQTLTTAYNGIR